MLPDPTVTVFNAANDPVADAAGWSSPLAATMAAVGAFPLAPGGGDTAVVATFAPGSYTAVVTGAAGGAGLALSEIYEPGAGPGASAQTKF